METLPLVLSLSLQKKPQGRVIELSLNCCGSFSRSKLTSKKDKIDLHSLVLGSRLGWSSFYLSRKEKVARYSEEIIWQWDRSLPKSVFWHTNFSFNSKRSMSITKTSRGGWQKREENYFILPRQHGAWPQRGMGMKMWTNSLPNQKVIYSNKTHHSFLTYTHILH